jgi:hypothetical protein
MHLLLTKAKRSIARATVLQAGAVEVTAPSGLAAIAGTIETQLPQLGQELRAASRLDLMRASRLSMSTCGLTSRRSSPRAPLAKNEWQLTKEARGLPAVVRGARRTNTPSRWC